jgi:hypothetical protein
MRISTPFLSSLFTASIILGTVLMEVQPIQGATLIGKESQRTTTSGESAMSLRRSNHHKRSLKKGKKGKKKKKGKKTKSRVVTMWWIVFNKPSECTGGSSDEVECGLSDLMGAASSGDNKPMVAVFHATGGVADDKGHLRLTATLYKTSTPLDLTSDADEHYVWGGPPPLYNDENGSIGYSPADGEDAEVLVVFHDHGPPAKDEDDLLKQLTRFNDPLCGQNGGSNTCVDVGFAAFPTMSSDETVSAAISGFPMFPEGCAKEDECTRIQEQVQLDEGQKMAHLIRSGGGDSIQVVAELRLPKVRM